MELIKLTWGWSFQDESRSKDTSVAQNIVLTTQSRASVAQNTISLAQNIDFGAPDIVCAACGANLSTPQWLHNGLWSCVFEATAFQEQLRSIFSKATAAAAGLQGAQVMPERSITVFSRRPVAAKLPVSGSAAVLWKPSKRLTGYVRLSCGAAGAKVAEIKGRRAQ